ncbi:hypothetical protein KC887_02120 [Candidatus Kaiserbacteria bacterium]|nr:hypothetical protein [Candidatus Kaiserbacteria bacterium]
MITKDRMRKALRTYSKQIANAGWIDKVQVSHDTDPSPTYQKKTTFSLTLQQVAIHDEDRMAEARKELVQRMHMELYGDISQRLHHLLYRAKYGDRDSVTELLEQLIKDINQ